MKQNLYLNLVDHLAKRFKTNKNSVLAEIPCPNLSINEELCLKVEELNIGSNVYYLHGDKVYKPLCLIDRKMRIATEVGYFRKNTIYLKSIVLDKKIEI